MDLKSSKAAKGTRRVQIYRVRGMPCKEWFDAKEASLAKALDLETEVRQSIKLIQAAQPRKRTIVQPQPLGPSHSKMPAAGPSHSKMPAGPSHSKTHAAGPSPSKMPGTSKAPQRPQKAAAQWVSPMEYDGNWMKIHIRVRRA